MSWPRSEVTFPRGVLWPPTQRPALEAALPPLPTLHPTPGHQPGKLSLASRLTVGSQHQRSPRGTRLSVVRRACQARKQECYKCSFQEHTSSTWQFTRCPQAHHTFSPHKPSSRWSLVPSEDEQRLREVKGPACLRSHSQQAADGTQACLSDAKALARSSTGCCEFRPW